MAYLLDTNVLVRLGNTVDVRHAVAAHAVLELHRRGEAPHITPPFNVAHFARPAGFGPGVVVVDPASV